MTADAVIEYRDEDSGLVFRWHGGAYIEVGYERDPAPGSGPHPSGFQADDVINVWNDELDESYLESEVQGAAVAGVYLRRPFRAVLERFEDRCEQYLTEMREQYLTEMRVAKGHSRTEEEQA